MSEYCLLARLFLQRFWHTGIPSSDGKGSNVYNFSAYKALRPETKQGFLLDIKGNVYTFKAKKPVIKNPPQGRCYHAILAVQEMERLQQEREKAMTENNIDLKPTV